MGWNGNRKLGTVGQREAAWHWGGGAGCSKDSEGLREDSEPVSYEGNEEGLGKNIPGSSA